MPKTIEYRGYKALVTFSAKDELFVGSVLDIRDPLNFYGATIKETIEDFRSCIDNYLQLCSRLGRTSNQPFLPNGEEQGRGAEHPVRSPYEMSEEEFLSRVQYAIDDRDRASQ